MPSTAPAASLPRLYHAPSSYYSMIARLALAETGIAYTPVRMEIHARLEQQRPDYARLNPNMTVPTLVLPAGGQAARVLTESRDIATYAFGVESGLDEESQSWLELHYALPIEQLTFGRALARSRLARVMVPKLLARARRNLLKLAAQNPDLAALYEARAATFTERLHAFDPHAVMQLARQREAQAMDILERMERALHGGRATLTASGYGIADTVLTVFLARIEFTGLGAEIQHRLALARYWQTMQARPSFAQADIWTRLHRLRMLRGVLGL